MSTVLDRRPQKLDIVISSGDSLTMVFNLTNKSDNTPVDLSGKVIEADFNPFKARGDAENFSVAVVDNTVTLSITPSQTTGKVKDNIWKCTIRNANSSEKFTFVAGRFIIERQE